MCIPKLIIHWVYIATLWPALRLTDFRQHCPVVGIVTEVSRQKYEGSLDKNRLKREIHFHKLCLFYQMKILN